MSLRLRRGTDVERQSVVFAEGELVYTTDLKEIYIGDGVTLGGIKVTSAVDETPIALTRDLDLNSFDITGSGDIDINGAVTANMFYGSGAQLTDLPLLNVNNGAAYQINIVGADSSIIVNSDTSELYGSFFGDFQGNSKGLFIGNDSSVMVNGDTSTFTGNFVGNAAGLTNFPADVGIVPGGNYNINVVGDDSTVIINSRNSSINSDLFYSNDLAIRRPSFSADPFEVAVVGLGTTTAIRIVTQSDNNLTGTSYSGKLWFGYEDPTGANITSGILGGENAMYFVSNASSDFTNESNYLSWIYPGKLGIGTYTPAQELDVRGNAIVTGFVQFGSLSTTERDAITPAAGMIIWNSSTVQFEGFNGTNWINLIDGVISA